MPLAKPGEGLWRVNVRVYPPGPGDPVTCSPTSEALEGHARGTLMTSTVDSRAAAGPTALVAVPGCDGGLSLTPWSG
jgi:hypothetical protein